MQPSGFSPYRGKDARKPRLLKLPEFSGGFKKWLLIVLGILFGLFLIFYVSLGELRFFANHFLRLGFFHKNYLILLQNNYESRPTGGFITGYGEVSVTMGIPSGISFHNSYEIDTETYVTPPYPHDVLLKNESYAGYTFRDANWNPDFPESAKTLIDFYQKKYPDKDVDGIIVVNFSMIEALVDKLGGIEMGDQKVTKDNLFKTLTDSVNDVDRHNVDALAERKDILGQLVGPLMSSVKWHPFKAKEVVINALHDKDMYLWFKSEGMEAKVQKKGWANDMALPENSDFLAVNIANLGSKKADRYVIKEVYQHVNLKNEVPEVTLDVTLKFPGEKNMYADDYKGYLRVFVPQGVEVTSENKEAKIDVEGDFKVIGEEIHLPAGEEKTFTYTYQLPRSLLKDKAYALRLIKQSGDQKHYVVTAESKEDSGMESDDFSVLENKAMWAGTLQNDLDLSLTMLPDTTGPYPIDQFFTDLKTITIYWNEGISDRTGGDALNYEITDLNVTDSETTDEVKVTYAEVINKNTVKLEVEGITKQDLERYRIKLKDIEDVANNSINPNPKLVTAVQRIGPTESKNKAEAPKVGEGAEKKDIEEDQ